MDKDLMDKLVNDERCDDCRLLGHCEIEPLVRFIQSHKDRVDAMVEAHNSYLTDLFSTIQRNTDDPEAIADLFLIAGMAMTMGVELSCKPEPEIPDDRIVEILQEEGISEENINHILESKPEGYRFTDEESIRNVARQTKQLAGILDMLRKATHAEEN